MKKPYFNQLQRQMIRVGTLQGDGHILHLRIKQLQRSVRRHKGCIMAWLKHRFNVFLANVVVSF
jgi:hypothetical protein